MYELTISGDFAAAHFLKGYDGSCSQMHGHTWKLEVTVFSDQLNEIGLVLDFKELKQKMKKVLSQLDHQCLNDNPAFKKDNPTTENLAKYIYHEFGKTCDPIRVKQVRVWESDKASVIYYE